MKPFAQSCQENQTPILNAIQPLLTSAKVVLEIGSGTGQHAVHFAEQMPHLTWHTSDQALYHKGINAWLDEAQNTRIKPPIELDVTQSEQWPDDIAVDAIFTANTLHIMGVDAVKACFAGVGRLLPANGLFITYGPFNYNGQFTSASNERFDAWLKQQNSESGIRHIEELTQFANDNQLTLIDDIAMPANNRTLCWQKQAS